MTEHRRAPRGDEADLFASFHLRFLRIVQRHVRTSPEIVEDACLFAWAQFIEHQPDRDRNWRSWLVKTAEREAWRLHGVESRTRSLETFLEQTPNELARVERRDDWGPRDRVREAFQALAAIPERRREVKSLWVTGFTYDEIGEMLGLTYTQVNRLMSEANAAIRKHQERAPAEPLVLPPRAARLHELETNPPGWLLAAIGRRPTPHVNQAATRDWRRAALAIDDYRREYGSELGEDPLGRRPDDAIAALSFDRAIEAIRRARLTGAERRTELER